MAFGVVSSNYDYSKLRGKIVEKFGSFRSFGEAMNMGYTSLSFRLNNKAEWSQEEMKKAMELLGEDSSSVTEYFFAHRL